MIDWLRPILVAAVSLTLSIGGVVIAICITHCKEDALRGGALGTALALLFMFAARNYGLKLYDEAKKLDDLRISGSRAEPAPSNAAPLTIEALAQRIETLRSAIVTDGDELKRLNGWLVFATCVAAVICAFGDKIAAHIATPSCH